MSYQDVAAMAMAAQLANAASIPPQQMMAQADPMGMPIGLPAEETDKLVTTATDDKKTKVLQLKLAALANLPRHTVAQQRQMREYRQRISFTLEREEQHRVDREKREQRRQDRAAEPRRERRDRYDSRDRDRRSSARRRRSRYSSSDSRDRDRGRDRDRTSRRRRRASTDSASRDRRRNPSRRDDRDDRRRERRYDSRDRNRSDRRRRRSSSPDRRAGGGGGGAVSPRKENGKEEKEDATQKDEREVSPAKVVGAGAAEEGRAPSTASRSESLGKTEHSD